MHGNKLIVNHKHIDVDAIDSLSHSTSSMIKCAAGISTHLEIIKLIDK